MRNAVLLLSMAAILVTALGDDIPIVAISPSNKDNELVKMVITLKEPKNKEDGILGAVTSSNESDQKDNDYVEVATGSIEYGVKDAGFIKVVTGPNEISKKDDGLVRVVSDSNEFDNKNDGVVTVVTGSNEFNSKEDKFVGVATSSNESDSKADRFDGVTTGSNEYDNESGNKSGNDNYVEVATGSIEFGNKDDGFVGVVTGPNKSGNNDDEVVRIVTSSNESDKEHSESAYKTVTIDPVYGIGMLQLRLKAERERKKNHTVEAEDIGKPEQRVNEDSDKPATADPEEEMRILEQHMREETERLREENERIRKSATVAPADEIRMPEKRVQVEMMDQHNAKLLNRLGMKRMWTKESGASYEADGGLTANHYQKRLASQSRSKYGSDAGKGASDSQMFIVKLPPHPYFYGDNSAAASRPRIQDKQQQKQEQTVMPLSYNGPNSVPVGFTSNGKPAKVYHWNLPFVKYTLNGNRYKGADGGPQQRPGVRFDDLDVAASSSSSDVKPAQPRRTFYYKPRAAGKPVKKSYVNNGKPDGFYVVGVKPPQYYKIIDPAANYN